MGEDGRARLLYRDRRSRARHADAAVAGLQHDGIAAAAASAGARARLDSASGERPVSLAVDRYELGPIGTNCYVVRAIASARRGGRRRPGGDAAQLRLELARLGARVRRDPDHARPLGPPRRRRRPRRGHRRARLHGRGRARAAREPARTSSRPGVGSRARTPPTSLARGRRDARARRASASRRSASPATRPATSPTTRTAASSPATCSSPARSAAPTCPGADWDTLVESIRDAHRALPARDGRLLRATARRRRSATELARNPFLARAARLVTSFEAPRGTHDILPSEQPLLAAASIGEAERLCSLYGYRPIQTPVFEDTALFARTSGAGLGRRAEGDVHVRGPRRPLAHAAPRGHGADRARVPRARPAPRAAAGQALHDRDDVPLRGAAARALPRALAALGRGDRLGRPCDRRRGDPALRRAARAPRRDETTSCCSTRSATRTAGPRTSSS